MHVQQVADAVAGAVVIVEAQLPERHARQDVEVDAGAALLEAGGRHVQMAAQHGGVVALLLFGELADRKGAGDVGAALEIVSAGIDQQEAIESHGDVGLLGGLVVDDGAVLAGGDDRRKALIDEIGALFAVGKELRAHIELGDLAAANGAVLLPLAQPADQPRDSHAVLNVRLALVFHLDGVLGGLGQRARVGLVDELYALGHGADQRDVGLGAAQEQALARGQRPQILIDLQVGPQRDAVGLQLCAQLVGDGLGRGVEDRVIRAQERIGIEHRAVSHVASAEVIEPGHVVKRGDKVPVGAELGHLRAQERELIRAASAGVGRVQFPDRVRREGRAVRPQLAHEVERFGIADRLAGEGGFQRAGVGVGDGAAVIAEALAVAQGVFEVFGDGRHAGLAHFAQLDAGILQLLRRREEVAAVRPQAGLVRRNDERARAAAKARQPLAALEIAVHVLRGVEIVRQHQIGVHAVFTHFLPQRGHARADRRRFMIAHSSRFSFRICSASILAQFPGKYQ